MKVFCFHCRTTFTDGVSCQATRRSEIGEKLPTATRRSEIGEAVRFIGGQRESRRLHRVAAAGRRAVGRVVVHEDRRRAEGAAECAGDERGLVALVVEGSTGESLRRRRCELEAVVTAAPFRAQQAWRTRAGWT